MEVNLFTYLWKKYINVGINSQMTEEEIRSIVVCNRVVFYTQLTVILIFGILAVRKTMLSLTINLNDYRFLLFFLASYIVLMLNKYRQYQLAKFTLSNIILFFVIYFPLFSSVSTDHFLSNESVIIGISPIIHFITVFKKDKYILILTLLILFLSILFSDLIFLSYAKSTVPGLADILTTNYFNEKMAHTMSFLFLNSSLYIYKKDKFNQQNELNKKNYELKEFHEELLVSNEELTANNEQISMQNDLIIEQKDKIEYLHNEFMQSILYAQKIQESMMPQGDKVSHCFAENFFLYIPKDGISGDFYWATCLDNKCVVVAADCTGHGVPGALMSMLGIALLNEIVIKDKVLSSNSILDRLRSEVISSLNTTQHDDYVKYGMDISLCVFDFDKQELQFSGAFNSLLIFRNGLLSEINADKMPIGSYILEGKPFNSTTIKFYKDDIFYMFSDGYADQFGGERNKKFKKRNFKNLLTENAHLPLAEQKKLLQKHKREWQGNFDQTDDILVIGLRI